MIHKIEQRTWTPENKKALLSSILTHVMLFGVIILCEEAKRLAFGDKNSCTVGAWVAELFGRLGLVENGVVIVCIGIDIWKKRYWWVLGEIVLGVCLYFFLVLQSFAFMCG